MLAEVSLDLWVETFTGREAASRKSETRFLLIISEWIRRNSGLEDDRDVLRGDVSIDKDMVELAWLVVM